jgi:hypothetical protein
MTEDQEKSFNKHLKSLKLKTVQDYRAWCNKNGFSSNLNKNELQRSKELQVIKDEKVAEELNKSKIRLQPTSKILKEILNNKIDQKDIKSPILNKIFAETEKHSDKSGVFKFIADVEEKSDFIELGNVVSSFGSKKGNSYLKALVSIYEYSFFWVKKVEDWVPNSHNPHRQFISLVTHLFCKYKTPLFLFSSWFSGKPGEVDSFICLAQGDNFKESGFKVDFTKKQIQFFLRSPDHYTIAEALRFGQIIGLNGDVSLVEAINQLNLPFDDFWNSFILILINNPMLDRYQVGPIVDYIKSQKFAENAPHPSLSLKGRTAESLLRQTESWHARLRKERPKNFMEWKPSGFLGFEKIEGKEGTKSFRVWKVIELLNNKELSKEGASQKHCIYSYAHSASVGRTSIWSLRVSSYINTEETVLTIEINRANNSIVQARMKYNKLPDEKSNQIMTEWANREGISVSLRYF